MLANYVSCPLFRRSRNFHVENVVTDFVLEVEANDVVGVGGQQNVFAGVGSSAGEGLEVRALGINRGGGLEGWDLIGEQGGLSGGGDHAAQALRFGFVDRAGGLCFRKGVSPNIIGSSRQNFGQPRLGSGDDLFVIRGHFHRRVEVLQ